MSLMGNRSRARPLSSRPEISRICGGRTPPHLLLPPRFLSLGSLMISLPGIPTGSSRSRSSSSRMVSLESTLMLHHNTAFPKFLRCALRTRLRSRVESRLSIGSVPSGQGPRVRPATSAGRTRAAKHVCSWCTWRRPAAQRLKQSNSEASSSGMRRVAPSPTGGGHHRAANVRR